MGNRKKGSGGISKRKDGRWEGRVVVSYDEKGLPKTKNVLAKTKSECIEKLEKLKAECGQKKSDTIKPDMLFGDWVDYWYRTYSQPKLRPSTQNGYENMVYKHIIPLIGQKPLNEVTQANMNKFYKKLKTSGRIPHQWDKTEHGRITELSDRTVRSCHLCCRMALQKAVEENLIPSNPTDDCKLPPKRSREMEVLTKEEMQRFLIQAKEEGYLELFLLEISTGMRRGELLGLKWDDLNFNTHELRIQRQVQRINGKLEESVPKTKSSVRTIVVPESIVKMLGEHRKKVNSEWIFPSPLDSKMPRDPRAVTKRMELILERSGCKNIRFHDLRHTFATMSLEYGMDIKTLSSLLGHVSADTTLDIYSHVTDEMQRKAAENIDRKIARKEQKEEMSGNTRKNRDDNRVAKFEPYKGKIRKSGTGCISQINENLWEGRYSPKVNGKRMARNVYAHSREECEEKLGELIKQMKVEIAELKTMGQGT